MASFFICKNSTNGIRLGQAEQSREVSVNERRDAARVNGNCRIFVASASGGIYREAQF